ncbi:Plasmid stability protein [Micrococcales bacterium KH10]|nr:Plasmid stability protein [Micrococcales bacterium KH10]
MEQILIRNLPPGTKAALRARAQEHHRSLEAEARALLTEAVQGKPATIVDLLAMNPEIEIEFEPEKLGLQARTPEL